MIENALHAMPGRGRLTIRAAARRPLIVIDITDTGVGMDADAIGRMFEPYFSTKATGTGLGLTIAKRNIELDWRNHCADQQASDTVTITVPAATCHWSSSHPDIWSSLELVKLTKMTGLSDQTS